LLEFSIELLNPAAQADVLCFFPKLLGVAGNSPEVWPWPSPEKASNRSY